MLPTVFLADVHVGHRYLSIPQMAQDAIREFRRACEWAVANGYTRVSVAGDMFDTNRPAPADIIAITSIVTEFTAKGLEFFGIAGDHDKPVSGASWVEACGFKTDIGYPELVMVDYDDNPDVVMAQLCEKLDAKRNTVECIVLHGQVPELFPFTEPKKTLRLKELNLCQYPKLLAVVVGDLHDGPEGAISEPDCGDREIDVIYPGSLFATDSSQLHKSGYLLWNGQKWERQPYNLGREILDFELDHEQSKDPDYVHNVLEALKTVVAGNDMPVEPLIVIRYQAGEEEILDQVHALELPAIVKSYRVASVKPDKPKQTVVAMRSQLKAANRVSDALNASCDDPDAVQLCWEMISAEQRGDNTLDVLMAFKTKHLDDAI